MSVSLVFPKAARLRRRAEFIRLAQRGERCVGRLMIVEIGKRMAGCTRLGLTASRHYGKAHERNRFKRLVREAFRLARHRFPEGYDLNVKPRPYIKTAGMQMVMKELMELFENYLSRA